MGNGANGKAKNKASKGAKNIKAANYIIDYQLSHKEACENIGEHRPADKLLGGKSNIDSYLKSLGFNADEEIRTGDIPGEFSELKAKVYETFKKNKFRDEEWYNEIDKVSKGQTRRIKPEYITKAVESYNDFNNDECTTRAARKIAKALTNLGLPVPTEVISTNVQKPVIQMPAFSFTDVNTSVHAGVNVADAVKANACAEFQEFMIESSTITINKGDVGVLIEKYGATKVDEYYLKMMKLGNALYESLHLTKIA